MPSVREIKRRIQSVENISQVTRALEAVSASKARRAQQQAERSRPYAQSAWEVLVNLAGQPGSIDHPLLTDYEEIKTIDVILITGDRGLAGAYNMNIIRAAEQFVEASGRACRWITIGRKGRDYLVRRKANVVAEFSNLPADLSLSAVMPAGEMVVNDFLSGATQQVFVAYTDFINVLTQRPAVVNLLPLKPIGDQGMIASDYIKEEPEQTVQDRIYTYEPSAEAILNEVVPRFTALQVYQAVLESFASEHSARMVAMRNASENAVALAADLTLEYNKARQLAITSEILDIVGGVEALKGTESKKKKTKAARGHDVVRSADRFIGTMTAELVPEKKENLKRIEGIGPKVEKALNASGITTFSQLAQMTAEEIERIVKQDHGVNIVGDAATWPKQAQFVVNGDESGLQEYQDKLTGGREA